MSGDLGTEIFKDFFKQFGLLILPWCIIVAGIITAIIFWPRNKPVPYDNTVLTQVLQRQERIDSLVRDSHNLLKQRDLIIYGRDTLVLAATERTLIKYYKEDEEINNAPVSVQPAITERLHARYDQRRLKESK